MPSAKLTTEPELYGKPLRQSLKGCRGPGVGITESYFRFDQEQYTLSPSSINPGKYKGVGKRGLNLKA